MTTEFIDFNLNPKLTKAIAECGYLVPMPIQSEIIPIMVSGRDVIGQAQTGTGKTAAFALPILQNLEVDQIYVQSLILTPTRELALQVANDFTQYGQFLNVRVQAVYGGQSYAPQINQLKKGVHIVVGTPGRLIDLIQRHILDISRVQTVVLDEADEMLSMGFIEDIETILKETPATRQTALFSATLPTEIRRLADQYLHDPVAITIKRQQVTAENIEQRYYLINEKDKLAALTRLFEMEDVTRVLIFVRTRAGTAELANELTARGFPAEALNGDLSQEARERTLNRFRQNKMNVLVATDVAARGLDIDDISHVVNFDLPEDPEIYVHRIGRTGRAGKAGIAISLVNSSKKRLLRQIEGFTHEKLNLTTLPSEEDIRNNRDERLLNQMSIWLKRGRYHRERELVDKLIQEGLDPLEIAAAALKIARAEDKQRPIAAISEVVETKSYRSDRESRRGNGKERFQRWSAVSHEPGMVRLSLKLGKMHGIRPNDIVGAIASQANIPGHSIGKINIQEKQSMVDVPEEFVTQVLGKNREIRIHRQPLDLQRA